MGDAINNEITTSLIKSFDSNTTTPCVVAPNTLRIPTSFLLRSAVYAAKPNKPKQPTKIAMHVNIKSNVLACLLIGTSPQSCHPRTCIQ